MIIIIEYYFGDLNENSLILSIIFYMYLYNIRVGRVKEINKANTQQLKFCTFRIQNSSSKLKNFNFQKNYISHFYWNLIPLVICFQNPVLQAKFVAIG